MLNVLGGLKSTLSVIVPTCVSNTYSRRRLLPLLGLCQGCARVLVAGGWYAASRVLGCLRLAQGTCLLAGVWLLLTALLFSPHSAAAPSHSAAGGAGSGVGAVCVEGALTGAVLRGFAILFYVVAGKVSRSVASMHGFDATVLFSYAMVLWSLSSALSLALSPELCLIEGRIRAVTVTRARNARYAHVTLARVP